MGTIDKFSCWMDHAKTAHFTLCLMPPAHHADGTCNQILLKETVFQHNTPPLLHNQYNKLFNKLSNQSLQPAPGATVDSEMKYSFQTLVHSNSINLLNKDNLYGIMEEVLALPITKPANFKVSTESYNF